MKELKTKKERLLKRKIKKGGTLFYITIMEERPYYNKYKETAVVQVIRNKKTVTVKKAFYEEVLKDLTNDEIFEEFRDVFEIPKSVRILAPILLITLLGVLIGGSIITRQFDNVIFDIILYTLVLILVFLALAVIRQQGAKEKRAIHDRIMASKTRDSIQKEIDQVDKTMEIVRLDRDLTREAKKLLTKEYNHILKSMQMKQNGINKL